MKRRTVLVAVGVLATVGLGGCLGDGDGNGGGDARTAANRTATPTATATDRDVTTPSPDPYTMQAGSVIVAVTVDPDFDGEVQFTADCREMEVVIPSGERAEVVRDEPGESCPVSLTIDGETALSETIYGYESARLTVTADGELDGGRIML